MIGSGSSAIDLVIMLSNIVRNITISARKWNNGLNVELESGLHSYLPNVILRPKINRFVADGAEFIDGTKQTFTSVIYATGYKYSYPFLSFDC